MILNTYEERIKFISKLAQRQKFIKKMKAKVINSYQLEENQKQKPLKNLTEIYDNQDHEIYHKDEKEYAKKYYGETFYHTTKFDNQWD